jgi:hypothetical protein
LLCFSKRQRQSVQCGESEMTGNQGFVGI